MVTAAPEETVTVKLLVIAGIDPSKVIVSPAIWVQSIVSPEVALKIQARREPPVKSPLELVTLIVFALKNVGRERLRKKGK